MNIIDHKTSVPAVVVEHYDDLAKQAGSVQFFTEDKGLRFNCPCGCGQHGAIPFSGRHDASVVSWQWDGDRTKPSLSPSIRRVGGCKWHGHLAAGVWVPCTDSGL